MQTRGLDAFSMCLSLLCTILCIFVFFCSSFPIIHIPELSNIVHVVLVFSGFSFVAFSFSTLILLVGSFDL